MAEIDTKDRSEKESGNAEYAKFWSQPGLEEYDHKIFEGEKVSYKSLTKNASFLRASALVYEMKNGETWEAKIAREGLVTSDGRPTQEAIKKLGEYGIDTIRWFNNNSASTIATASEITKSARDDQKVAMLYMMQAYEHSKISLSGFFNALGMGIVDPLNATAFVTGAATLGGSAAVIQAGKETAKVALKEILMAGLKDHLTKKGAILLGSMAAEGALAGAIQRDREQVIETQKAHIGGKTIQYKQDYSWGDTGASALGGAVVGTAFGVGGRALGNTFQWGKFNWEHRNVDTTPAGQIIPNAYESWLNKLIKRNPFQWFNEQTHTILSQESTGVAKAHKNLPFIDLFSVKFIRKAVNYSDDAVGKSGVIQPIFDLHKKMENFRVEWEKAGNSSAKEALEKGIKKEIAQFSIEYRKDFKKLKEDLKPLLQELARTNSGSVTGDREGKVGLTSDQLNAMHEWQKNVAKICDALQDSRSFWKYYQDNWSVFKKVNKDGPGITGALQHLTELAAEADLHLRTRGLTGWEPKNGLIATGLKKFQFDIKDRKWKDTEAVARILEETKDLDESVRQERLKEAVVFFQHEKIADGEDGLIASGKYSRFAPTIENIQRQERRFKEALYNPAIRFTEMDNNKSLNSIENMENYAMVIVRSFNLRKDKTTGKLSSEAEKQHIEDLIGFARQSYKIGREAEFLTALRRLGMQQGRDGTNYTIPKGFPSALLKEAKMAWEMEQGSHLHNFVKATEKFAHTENSPNKYDVRDMQAKLVKVTGAMFDAKLAPYQDIIGVPGVNFFIKQPLSWISTNVLATALGGRVVPRIAEKTGEIDPTNPFKLKMDWGWNAAPAEAGRFERYWHNMTARNFMLNFIFTPITLPARMTKSFVDTFGNPIKNHTARTFVYGVGALHGLEEGFEYLAGEETDLDIAPIIWGGAIASTDFVVGGLARTLYKGATYPVQWVTNGLTSADVDLSGTRQWIDNTLKLPTDSILGVKIAGYTPLSDIYDANTNEDALVGIPGLGSLGGTTLDPSQIIKTSSAATNATGATMTNNSNNATTSPAIPLPVISASPDEQQARQVILALGRGVSDLHSAAARDGWTDENKHKLAELQANYQAYAPKAKEFGGHAEDIVKKAGNVLNHTLEPNAKIDTRPPENISSFETQQKERLNETMKLLATWQNGLITLNNDIAKADTGTNGWTDERKKKLAGLETNGKSFTRDIFFLTPEQQKIFSDASNMQFLLLQAKESDQPVAASATSLIPAPSVAASTREAPTDKGHIKPATPATTADDTAEKAEKTAATPKKESSAKETSTNETGNSGASARTVSHNTDDGSFFGSLGGHARDLSNSFKRMTKVDDGDEVTNTVSSTIGLLGAAGEKGAGFVGNTYDRLMAKQDRSGRSLIREAGAGILALVGMGSLFGPMLDRIGIGTIPIVGTIAKLATVVVVFMAARKAVDSALPDVTPYAGQHVLQASAADRTRTHLPTLTQEEMNAGGVTYMSNKGGEATVDRVRDAMQSASANDINKTHVSNIGPSTTLNTGVRYLPADAEAAARIARNNAINADRTGNELGGNVTHVNFNRPPAPAPLVDGNLALRGNEL